MLNVPSSFSHSLQLDWQRANQQEASFRFYQSTDPEGLCRFACAFAKEQQVPVKHICLSQNSTHAPFTAIFNLLINILNASLLDIEKIVAQATSYKPLQQKLTAILKGKRFQRSEMIVIDDLFFEKQAISNAIVNLVEILITTPTIIVISSWHYASASTIELLKVLVAKKLTIPLMVMVSIDPQNAFANQQEDEAWEGFLDWLDDTFLLHYVPESNNTESPEWSFNQEIVPSAQLVEQNANLMAWPEVQTLSRMLLETRQLPDQEKVQLHLLFAEALLFTDDLSSALSELESLLVFQDLTFSTDDKVRLYNLLSITLVQRQSFEGAMQYAETALDIAKQAADGQLLAQSMFVNFFAHDKSSTPLALSEFAKLEQELQRYKMDCSHLYVLRNYYSYLRFYDDLDSKSALTVTQRALKLARKIGHQQGIAASYHSKGIIYSYISHYHATFKCFAISARIRKQLGEANEQVRMHNGIGYFNTLLEQYPDAQTEYLAAYDIARTTGDDSELIVTIYNFAWLYFCTRNYQQATDILAQLLRICRIRKMTHFPFRNLYDVFSLKGFCHTKLGELTSAQQCLERMQELPFKPSSTGEFLRALLQGALYSASDNLQKAREIFEQAPAILGQTVDMDSRLLPQCSIELLEVYSRQGDWKACNKLADKSLAMCEALSLPRFSEIFTLIQQKVEQYQPFATRKLPVYPLREVSLQLDILLRSAKQVAQLRQVQKRLREMQLISRMQSLPERFSTTRELAEESLKLVCANFTVETGMIHHFNGEQWQQWSQVGKTLTVKDLNNYLAHIIDKKQPWVENNFCSQGEDGKRATYDSIACFPLFVDDHLYGAITLCNFNRNRYFDRQVQDTLQLLCKQLGSQLQQLKHSENLLIMSTTDQLTGLFNRQALLARLEQEITLYKQHADTYQCALAYIDLDNFKVVNDVLGHDVGDNVLKKFAELLTSSMRSVDIIARWGGDEFVVVFPNSNHQQAQISAKRLLQQLKKQCFFRRELCQWAENPQMVTNLPNLSCSIGITDCAATDYRLLNEDWLLKQADRGLYQAKAAGKGQISVITESIVVA